jgi:N-acetylmuramate 1-kinase
MNDDISLSPAQCAFIKKAVPGFSLNDWRVELAGRAASQRYFIRICSRNESYILIEWDSRDEDWDRFIQLGSDRETTGKLLPEVYANDVLHGLILEEDLGDTTLKKVCTPAKNNQSFVTEIYKTVLDALLRWHTPALAHHPVIAAREMDLETFLWETDYFARYCVKDFCGCESYLDRSWDEERTNMAEVCSSLPQTAIHRDFQSENILVCGKTIRFVDYQGARLGPVQYDIASLLFDPYCTSLDFIQCEELYAYYCGKKGNPETDTDNLNRCACQRLMQALGAYGNLSLHKGKQWYRDYIPVALLRLKRVVSQLPEYKRILTVVDACLKALEVKRAERQLN